MLSKCPAKDPANNGGEKVIERDRAHRAAETVARAKEYKLGKLRTKDRIRRAARAASRVATPR